MKFDFQPRSCRRIVKLLPRKHPDFDNPLLDPIKMAIQSLDIVQQRLARSQHTSFLRLSVDKSVTHHRDLSTPKTVDQVGVKRRVQAPDEHLRQYCDVEGGGGCYERAAGCARTKAEVEENNGEDLCYAAESEAYAFCGMDSMARAVFDARTQDLDYDGREDEDVDGGDCGSGGWRHGGRAERFTVFVGRIESIKFQVIPNKSKREV